jgi:NAD(P)-dependent dehydrogenase (short-subunit alcohol dehydrogenase family)
MATWNLSREQTLAERARIMAEIALGHAQAAGPDAAEAAGMDLLRALEAWNRLGPPPGGVPAEPRHPVGPEGGCILDAAGPENALSHRFGLRPERWESLAGKVTWIIGGGTGYGRAIATAISLAGGIAVISGRRQEILIEAAAKIERLGGAGRVAVLALDIAAPDACAQAVGAIIQGLGRLDALACCAALPGNPGSLLGMEETGIRALFEANALGQIAAVRAALPAMIAGEGGRVVLFSSEAAWGFPPGIGAYAVTKAAVNGIGATLAAEIELRFAGLDLQINVLDPGEARTEMNANSPVSPFSVCSMVLTLLSQPKGGPNGSFFHRDGRHLAYGYVPPWPSVIC